MINVDTVVANAASRRLSVVTHRELQALGLSAEQIGARSEQRLLVPMYQGVYRHAAAAWTPKAQLLAAVLASGPQAVASHRSAACLHQLRGAFSLHPEVTVPGRRLPRHRGITLHRTDLLEPPDVSSVDRIPVTTIPRTLLDLGAVVSFEVVELAAQDAMIQGKVSTVDLICVLERVGKRGRPGTAALRAVVRASLPGDGIESVLELALQRLVGECPIPRPVLQHEIVVAGRRVRLDSAWPELGIALEADGRRWHATRKDFEHDLARIRAITAAGWDHYRYGWNDVHAHPVQVRAEITAVVTAAMTAPMTTPRTTPSNSVA